MGLQRATGGHTLLEGTAEAHVVPRGHAWQHFYWASPLNQEPRASIEEVQLVVLDP